MWYPPGYLVCKVRTDKDLDLKLSWKGVGVCSGFAGNFSYFTLLLHYFMRVKGGCGKILIRSLSSVCRAFCDGSVTGSASIGSNELRCVMRFFVSTLAFSLWATFCHAQTAIDDATFLKQTRAKYDAPFERNLQSFSCAVQFNWKQHFTEAVRVGDEGTDDEIARLIQPIRNRVTVTRQNAAVSSGMSDDEEKKLPYGGMVEGLLEHAVQFSLNNWLVAGNNAMLPPESTPVHVVPSTSGYKLEFKVQTFDVEMMFAQDMSLQSEAAKGSASDRRETDFRPGPQGFLMTSYRLGEDGDFRRGNRILHTYTYQSVGGFQLPEQVSINRESHHEVWHYKLTDCTVKTNK